MTENLYYSKYLKYKNKYLELRAALNGGADDDTKTLVAQKNIVISLNQINTYLTNISPNGTNTVVNFSARCDYYNLLYKQIIDIYKFINHIKNKPMYYLTSITNIDKLVNNLLEINKNICSLIDIKTIKLTDKFKTVDDLKMRPTEPLDPSVCKDSTITYDKFLIKLIETYNLLISILSNPTNYTDKTKAIVPIIPLEKCIKK
jgi:hypothetical protein